MDKNNIIKDNNIISKDNIIYNKDNKDNIVLPNLVESLKPSTAYMLRNDGKLIECYSYHPYIILKDDKKLINKTKNKYFLIEQLFYDVKGADDLEWFYENSLNSLIKKDIRKIIQSLIQLKSLDEDNLLYSEKELISKYSIDENTPYYTHIEDVYSLIDELDNLTNQEFCRVRLSDMFLGGTSKDIYFRISSKGFNWFDLIWNVVFNYDISTVTVVKDYEGKDRDEEKIYEVGGISLLHLPRNEFLNLPGNPILESLNEDWREEVNKLNQNNFVENLTKYSHPEHYNSYMRWYDRGGMMEEDLKYILQPSKKLIEKIVKKGSKWQVQSEKGKNLGTYKTKKEAEDRLKQVEYFKNIEEKLIHVPEFRYNYPYDAQLFQSTSEAANYLKNLSGRNAVRILMKEYEPEPIYVMADVYDANHRNLADYVDNYLGDDSETYEKIVFTPIEDTRFDEADAIDDYYDYKYEWCEFIIFSRDDIANSKLYKALGEANYIEKLDSRKESLDESLLLEKKRSELISKSKSGDDYKSKNRKGQNRWDRRVYSRIATSVSDYNKIDMNTFWKEDYLEFKVKVQGETDNYEVTVTFENILDRIRREVEHNKNKLEFKCILRALMNAFNSEDVYVACSCPDFTYGGFNYYGVKQNYNSNPEFGKAMDAPVIRNPNDNLGAGCKHINLVLSNLNWMMKITSVINNYIWYCKDNMELNYARYIFPKLYGMEYDKAIQLTLFDTDELETSEEIINLSNAIGKKRTQYKKPPEQSVNPRYERERKEEPEKNPLGLKLDNDEYEEESTEEVESPEEEQES